MSTRLLFSRRDTPRGFRAPVELIQAGIDPENPNWTSGLLRRTSVADEDAGFLRSDQK